MYQIDHVNMGCLLYTSMYDESGLNHRRLQPETLAVERKKSVPGHKITKQRMTILCAANAVGTHKFRLSIVGKAKKPAMFSWNRHKFLSFIIITKVHGWTETFLKHGSLKRFYRLHLSIYH